MVYFSIAVLSVFSEIHHNEKLKTRKRQRSPDENNTTQVEPVKLEIGTQIEVSLMYFVINYNQLIISKHFTK